MAYLFKPYLCRNGLSNPAGIILFQIKNKTIVIWAEEIKKPKKEKSSRVLSVRAGLQKRPRKQPPQKKRKIFTTMKEPA